MTSLDVLVLNSGEWILGEEVAASPWHLLIYRQRGEPRNELHLWLPRADARRSGDHAFRRYWMEDGVRWCVEIPADPDRPASGRGAGGAARLRFHSTEGRVLWAELQGARGLGDLTEAELGRLLESAVAGTFHRLLHRPRGEILQ